LRAPAKKLPNRQNALISMSKLRGYLLSSEHAHGRHKAAFFREFGFSIANSEALASALRLHADKHEVAKVEDSPYGKRYVLDGSLAALDGRNPLVRAVWFIETGKDTPRFVTAYPLERP
jgi:hypothetical protein